MIEKPPLGVCSRKVWEYCRVMEVLAAIRRYSEAGKSVPPDWVDEVIDHLGKRPI